MENVPIVHYVWLVLILSATRGDANKLGECSMFLWKATISATLKALVGMIEFVINDKCVIVIVQKLFNE